MACKVIMVTSFKGGVGKSTVAANLALTFAQGGKKTLLVDCDFRMRSLDILLGVENDIIYDISDAMAGTCPLEKAIITDDRCEDLLFLPAPFNYRDGIDEESFSAVLKQAKETLMLDYIVLDTPGSSGQEHRAVTKNADEAYIIATHSFPSIRAAECTGRELEDLHVIERKLIINMFDTSGKDLDRKPTVVDIIDQTSIKLGGIIPHDSKITLMQDEGIMLDSVKESNIAKAFINIAKREEGKNVPLFTGFRGINRRKLLNI
ncbi:MAG: P-loop NTPase [Clostridia bacterium]|nr:P-loop NTPase [Clostridia bacterium]